MTELLIFIGFATLVVVTFTAIFIVKRYKRIAEELAGARNQSALEHEHTHLDHVEQNKNLKLIKDRQQWLMATKIAEEIKIAKANVGAVDGKDKPPGASPLI